MIMRFRGILRADTESGDLRLANGSAFIRPTERLLRECQADCSRSASRDSCSRRRRSGHEVSVQTISTPLWRLRDVRRILGRRRRADRSVIILKGLYLKGPNFRTPDVEEVRLSRYSVNCRRGL